MFLVAQSCLTLCNPVDCSQASSSPWGFSRQEFWSGLSCPLPGNLPNPGIKTGSSTLQADFLPSDPPGKPKTPGVGNLPLLQGIFPIQESNLGHLHCRQILYQLSFFICQKLNSLNKLRVRVVHYWQRKNSVVTRKCNST